MFCTECGQKVNPSAQFCAKCGHHVISGSIDVDQDIGTVTGGLATGLISDANAIPPGADATVKQDIDQVSGGTVTGAILGGSGATNVGGEHEWGDRVHGPKTDVRTDGGANVGGSVHTRGGDFVGRDKIVHDHGSRSDTINDTETTDGDKAPPSE